MMRRWIGMLFVLIGCLQGAIFAISDLDDNSVEPYTSSNDEVVAVKIYPESKNILPGQPLWMCVQFDIGPEWHLYWKNPGEVGAAPSISWKLPQGFRVGDALWPAPERYEIEKTVVFGYAKQLSILVPLYPPEDLVEGSTIHVKAEVHWLGCSTSCVPGDAFFTIPLQVSYRKLPIDSARAALFHTARAMLPLDVLQTQSTIKDGNIEIRISREGQFDHVSKVLFFPEEQNYFDVQRLPTWEVSLDSRTLIARVFSEQLAKNEAALPIKGVLVVQEKDHVLSWNIIIPFKSEATSHSTAFEKKAPQVTSIEALEEQMWYRKLSNALSHFLHSEFFTILVLAFFGGLILNVMPCVLPVISLKMLHFVQLQGQSRLKAAKHGLLYSFGVISSFWLLSGAIYFLQSFGKVVGWGFQLQEPLFVVALLIVLFIFGMSLFGVFEFLPSLASKAGNLEYSFQSSHPEERQHPSYLGSFFSGVLATFVASPCTGPLLGSAIGYAATLEPVYSVSMFTALGAGMSLPFLLLCLFPSLGRLLPRPGRWMVTFKQLMGFFMLATVLWLTWVLDAQTDNLSVLTMLTTLFVIAFGTWIYGTWGGVDRSKRVRTIAKVIALLVVLYGSYLLVSNVREGRMGTTEKPKLVKEESQVVGRQWRPFSQSFLDRLLQQRVPVFVYVTAKWCLTCQANHAVLELEKVRQAFVQYGVTKVEADWTMNDETITAYIRKMGRNGVPLAVVYSGNPNVAPKVLPEILTPEIVIEALQWASFEPQSQAVDSHAN